ncbi:unnamed protein product [Moneuplotes crassus]|uniref:Uncharacterized protein n=1 Tax=Euplotes crassus TaxID=5936 RepID=A0AAD1UGZ9_EUPCR|nr:unnamed protein product [Moneuplotes crassus]
MISPKRSLIGASLKNQMNRTKRGKIYRKSSIYQNQVQKACLPHFGRNQYRGRLMTQSKREQTKSDGKSFDDYSSPSPPPILSRGSQFVPHHQVINATKANIDKSKFRHLQKFIETIQYKKEYKHGNSSVRTSKVPLQKELDRARICTSSQTQQSGILLEPETEDTAIEKSECLVYESSEKLPLAKKEGEKSDDSFDFAPVTAVHFETKPKKVPTNHLPKNSGLSNKTMDIQVVTRSRMSRVKPNNFSFNKITHKSANSCEHIRIYKKSPVLKPDSRISQAKSHSKRRNRVYIKNFKTKNLYLRNRAQKVNFQNIGLLNQQRSSSLAVRMRNKLQKNRNQEALNAALNQTKYTCSLFKFNHSLM